MATATPVAAAPYVPVVNSGRYHVKNFERAQQITLGQFWTQVYNNMRGKDIKDCDVVELQKGDGETIADVRKAEVAKDWFGLHSLGVAVSLYVRTLVETKIAPVINKLREIRGSIAATFGLAKQRVADEMNFAEDINGGAEKLDQTLADPEKVFPDLTAQLDKIGPIVPAPAKK